MDEKKKLLQLGALCTAGMVALSGCKIPFFNPEQNEPVAVYGPPEMFEETFDPSQNVQNEVYGPPSYWGGTDEEDDVEESGEIYETDEETSEDE